MRAVTAPCLFLLFAALLCLAPPPAWSAHPVFAANGGAVPPAEAVEPSLDRMLGAMLMLGFRGTELAPDDPFAGLVASGRVGHVLLFDRDMPSGGGVRNVRTKEQVARLVAGLRAAARRPMLVAVDQEGGQVCRLKPGHGFMFVPAAKAMGGLEPRETGKIAARLGSELSSVGINLDFAPVVDVDANPDNPAIGRKGRSFGPDAWQVSAHARAFGGGLWSAGVIPALKHFPGQGCASQDSHLGLTDITGCFSGGRDLLPYGEAIRQGWPGVIMVGHLFHSGLDAKYPASLSRTVVTGLLRDGLGWQGVVVSDDMQMRAIADHYGLEEALFLAVNAGVDILVFGNNLAWQEDLPQKAHAALRRLVDSGRITPERVAESWRRIQALLASIPAGRP